MDASARIVGLGCNNLGDPITRGDSVDLVRRALDWGVTFVDTANCYGDGMSEVYLGEGLAGSGLRDSVTVATKFGSPVDVGPYKAPGGAAPEQVRSATEASLARLGVETIDVQQLHEPDPDVPIDETLGALGQLVAEGKIRTIGLSNFTAAQLLEAADAAERIGVRIGFVQVMWNLLYRDVEREIVPTCARIGAEIVPWFPLAGGLLTGKYARGAPFPPHTRFGRMPERIGFMASEQAFDRIDGLATVADEADVTMAELSIAWLAQQPSVHSVIAGAMNADQLEHSVHAQSVTLSPETLAAIDEICAQGVMQ